MIRLIDLPGASQLHARLQMCPHLCPSNDERSLALLGMVAGALGFELDHWKSIRMPELLPYEDPIEIDQFWEMDHDDMIRFWRRKGWDVTAEHGDTVSFLGEVLLAMIVIEEGRAGYSKVGLEAKLWATTRELSRQGRRKQDRDFLSLGQRARKRA